jgi:uncharacterized protein (TIGR03083 family)
MTESVSAEPTFDVVRAALENSHARFAACVAPLGDRVREPSYDDDWNIAQVAGHLGSGAEVFGLLIDAGVRREPAPGVEQFRPVWDRWNAKRDAEKARDAISADDSFLRRLDPLNVDQQRDWRLEVFGAERTLAGLLRMRLAEHALHTWDIVVALDPAAHVAADAVALVIDNLAQLVERAGTGAPEPVTVHVTTSEPERDLWLELTSETARLSVEPLDSTSASLRLPAEALLRLVYGRLDSAHTDAESVGTDGIDLDTLRRVFPGV